MLSDERSLPALYMVYRPHLSRPPTRPLAPDELSLRAVPDDRWDEARPVIELDGRLTDAQWANFVPRVFPGGLFVARDEASGRWVGTCSAVDNPQGARFHFPDGGELGFLVVEASFRGRGIGRTLVDAGVRRLTEAGCRHIWLGVEGWREPAIRTYLRAGFVPFLHPPRPDELAARWQRIMRTLETPVPEREWLLSLPH